MMGFTPSLYGSMLDPNKLLADQMEQIVGQATQAQQQAQANASQAQQQYQSAQQSPPNLALPLQALLPLIGASIASNISGNQNYAQGAEQITQQRRGDILARRAENLSMLAERHKAAADAAVKAGNIVDELKYRTSYDKLLKQYEDIQTKQAELRLFERTSERDKTQHGYDMELQELKNKGDHAKDARQRQAQRRQFLQSMNVAVRQDPDIKGFVTVRDFYARGQRAFQQKNNLGDTLLMRAVAKVSDPESSVREEEFKVFEKAQGLMARAGVTLTKAMWGKGTLNEYGRQEMLRALQDIYKTKEVQHQRAWDMYAGQGQEFDVDPKLYLRDYTIPGVSVPSGNAGPTQQSKSQPSSKWQQFDAGKGN